MRKIFAAQKGASAVEFALILPLLLLLIFGIIEFSIILYNKAMLTNASREGDRQGIVFYADAVTGVYTPKTSGDIVSIVDAYAQNHLITFGAGTSIITTTPSWDPSPDRGALLTVSAQYTYSFLVLPSFMSGLLDDTLTLEAVTVMRME